MTGVRFDGVSPGRTQKDEIVAVLGLRRGLWDGGGRKIVPAPRLSGLSASAVADFIQNRFVPLRDRRGGRRRPRLRPAPDNGKEDAHRDKPDREDARKFSLIHLFRQGLYHSGGGVCIKRALNYQAADGRRQGGQGGFTFRSPHFTTAYLSSPSAQRMPPRRWI